VGRAGKSKREWTTTEYRRVLQLRSQGVPTRDIAKQIGRTQSAIYSFLRDLPQRQKPRPIPPPKKAMTATDREREAARIGSEKYTAALLEMVF
jgi:IS30 family transposase